MFHDLPDTVMPLILCRLPFTHCIRAEQTCRYLRECARDTKSTLKAARTIRRFWQWCARFASTRVLETRFHALVSRPIADMPPARLIDHLRNPSTIHTTSRFYTRMCRIAGADRRFITPRVMLTACVLCYRPDVLQAPFGPVEMRIVADATHLVSTIIHSASFKRQAAKFVLHLAEYTEIFEEWENSQIRPHSLDVF